MNSERSVAVIVVSHAEPDDVLTVCLERAVAAARRVGDTEIVVADAWPQVRERTRRVVEAVAERCDVPGRVVGNGNRGFGAGVNLAADAATAELIWVVNPDAETAENAIEAAVAVAATQHAPCLVGAWPTRRDGSVFTDAYIDETSRIRLAAQRRLWDHTLPELDEKRLTFHPPKVCGVAFLAPRSEFLQLRFDERFFLYYEDSDLSRRARQDRWTVVASPRVVVVHDRPAGATATVEAARVDGLCRLAATQGRLARWSAWSQCLAVGVVGMIRPAATSSGSAAARRARFHELRRWARPGLPVPFDPSR